MDSLVVARNAPGLAAALVKQLEPEAAAQLLWEAATHAQAYLAIKAGRKIPQHLAVVPKSRSATLTKAFEKNGPVLLLICLGFASNPRLRETLASQFARLRTLASRVSEKVASQFVVMVLRVWVEFRKYQRKSIKDSPELPIAITDDSPQEVAQQDRCSTGSA